MGLRQLDGMSFVVMNSRWGFCKDKDDQGNLWLGLPILKELAAHKQIPNDTDRRDGGQSLQSSTIPESGFERREMTTYGPRTNPFALFGSAMRFDALPDIRTGKWGAQSLSR